MQIPNLRLFPSTQHNIKYKHTLVQNQSSYIENPLENQTRIMQQRQKVLTSDADQT